LPIARYPTPANVAAIAAIRNSRFGLAGDGSASVNGKSTSSTMVAKPASAKVTSAKLAM
jgi:hypothetical protein